MTHPQDKRVHMRGPPALLLREVEARTPSVMGDDTGNTVGLLANVGIFLAALRALFQYTGIFTPGQAGLSAVIPLGLVIYVLAATLYSSRLSSNRTQARQVLLAPGAEGRCAPRPCAEEGDAVWRRWSGSR